MRYKIGFKKLGSKNWVGGQNYLRNLTSIINSRLKRKIELKYIKNQNESFKNIDTHKFDKILSIKENNNIFKRISC